MAVLSGQWTWGDDLPKSQEWLPVSKTNSQRLMENNAFIVIRAKGKYSRFRKVVEDEASDLTLWQNSGMEKLLLRQVKDNFMWCVHADHNPEEGLVRFSAVSCSSARLMTTVDFCDQKNISIRDLEASFKERAAEADLITRQQQVILVSSVTGGLLSQVLTFVWGPRAHAALKPRKRVLRKTAANTVALQKLFEPVNF
ncbi:unnamed protein product [Symbiodinium sp. CCMP2592]|nr:unnamed protein product [Symbiodinium sp. CCMP2592]CAE7242178.1 unnamed protein product [Symbiodinium sp. CCMP2592]CAE7256344.1 unnamed protein product [Symbiodinium sp. CCMP2592]CAE7503732.1 unnamed protein product [Symbiodinium sp. CCMP2592]